MKTHDERYKNCYAEISALWAKYPIAEDYKKTLLHEDGYEKWQDSNDIDLFMASNYAFDDEINKIIEKHYGENWDVSAEFPEWCKDYFGAFFWHEFLEDKASDYFEENMSPDNGRKSSRVVLKKYNIKFQSETHKQKYEEFCSKMRCLDSYHTAVAYLFALDTACREHVGDVFDFGGNGIKIDGLHEGWQTSTSRRVTHLAFNLWNGYCYDGETYTDKDGYEADLPSAEYATDNIFCDSLAEYFFEAVRLRYPQYF